MHLEQSGDLGCRPTGREHAEDFRALCLSELRPSAARPPLRAGRFQAGLGALLYVPRTVLSCPFYGVPPM